MSILIFKSSVINNDCHLCRNGTQTTPWRTFSGITEGCGASYSVKPSFEPMITVSSLGLDLISILLDFRVILRFKEEQFKDVKISIYLNLSRIFQFRHDHTTTHKEYLYNKIFIKNVSCIMDMLFTLLLLYALVNFGMKIEQLY